MANSLYYGEVEEVKKIRNTFVIEKLRFRPRASFRPRAPKIFYSIFKNGRLVGGRRFSGGAGAAFPEDVPNYFNIYPSSDVKKICRGYTHQ